MGVRAKASLGDPGTSGLSTRLGTSNENSENGLDTQYPPQSFSSIVKRTSSNPMSRRYGAMGEKKAVLPEISTGAKVLDETFFGPNEFTHDEIPGPRNPSRIPPPIDAEPIRSAARERPRKVARPEIVRIPSSQIISQLPKLMQPSPIASSIFGSSSSQVGMGDIGSTASIDAHIDPKSHIYSYWTCKKCSTTSPKKVKVCSFCGSNQDDTYVRDP